MVDERIPEHWLSLPKYILLTNSVILNYGSGSWRPITYGSGSYLESFVVIDKICCQLLSKYFTSKKSKILDFFPQTSLYDETGRNRNSELRIQIHEANLLRIHRIRIRIHNTVNKGTSIAKPEGAKPEGLNSPKNKKFFFSSNFAIA
jgi:hypothetical protein